LYPTLKSHLTDFIYYADVDDIFRSRDQASEFIIRRGDEYLVMDSLDSEEIIKVNNAESSWSLA
jgi:hypothetical protein